MFRAVIIASTFSPGNQVTLYHGDCLDFLATLPDSSMQLVVTSPPYNIGKEYEERLELNEYLEQQRAVIAQCVRVLRADGSICWQVGNYVENGAIVPLDAALFPVFCGLGLSMRNRIVWRFGHGLHCKNRFSGRHECIIWLTKSDDYYFDLEPVRVPQKYPRKRHYK
ncbi:MAG: DNA methyltransferase, partial [Planctomycetes bacterium SM23_32]